MKKLILLIVPVLLSTGCVSVCVNDNQYEYIDMFGNNGTSNYCDYYFRSGLMYCELGEDSRVQVSQYKLISSDKTCN